jgi:hypothetical protein
MTKRTNIVKTSIIHYTVTYVVLEPDVEDLNGDIISKDEIIKTAHEFVINLSAKSINVDHEDGKEVEPEEARIVESYVTPVSIETDGGIISAGSRLVAIKFSPTMYEKVIAGEFVGVSLQGTGVQDPV